MALDEMCDSQDLWVLFFANTITKLQFRISKIK